MALSRELKILLGIFLGVMVTIVLLESAANPITASTTTSKEINVSITANQKTEISTLNGRSLVNGSCVVYNRTDYVVLTNAGNLNYTCYDSITNGKRQVYIILNAGRDAYNDTLNMNYSFEPYGYINDSAGRNVSTLILVVAALAILVFVVIMTWKKAGNILKIGMNRGGS